MKEKTEAKPIRFPSSQLAELKRVARKYDTSEAQLIRWALQAVLDYEKSLNSLKLPLDFGFIEKALTETEEITGRKMTFEQMVFHAQNSVRDKQADLHQAQWEENELRKKGRVLYPLPLLGAVAAGEPVEAPMNNEKLLPKEYPSGHFVVEVNGQSAEPEFEDGSQWVIDGRDCFTPKDGKPCVVSDENGSYLKKWNRKKGLFESINPAFNDVLPGDSAKLRGYPVERV